jgi:hypothetical protein
MWLPVFFVILRIEKFENIGITTAFWYFDLFSWQTDGYMGEIAIFFELA